jgi:hypothetical protein
MFNHKDHRGKNTQSSQRLSFFVVVKKQSNIQF